MPRRYWVVLLLTCIVVSCNSENIETSQQDDYNYLPKVDLKNNKSIDVSFSRCDFESKNLVNHLIYKKSSSDNQVKLLLGSTLTCDYKNGAFIKELMNTSDSLKVEIYQKGERLSNECECYFYFEIRLKNKTSFPYYVEVNGEKYGFYLTNPLSEVELQTIEKKLIK